MTQIRLYKGMPLANFPIRSDRLFDVAELMPSPVPYEVIPAGRLFLAGRDCDFHGTLTCSVQAEGKLWRFELTFVRGLMMRVESL